jgi:hypothetical protein
VGRVFEIGFSRLEGAIWIGFIEVGGVEGCLDAVLGKLEAIKPVTGADVPLFTTRYWWVRRRRVPLGTSDELL